MGGLNEETDLALLARREEVVHLRSLKMTFKQISAKVGCSVGTAHGDFKKEIKRRYETLGETVDEIRMTEMIDLDRHERTLNSKLLNSELPFRDYVRGLTAMIRIKQRRADLIGLDLADPDVTFNVGINMAPDANTARRSGFAVALKEKLGRVPTVEDVRKHLRENRLRQLEHKDGNGNGQHFVDGSIVDGNGHGNGKG